MTINTSAMQSPYRCSRRRPEASNEAIKARLTETFQAHFTFSRADLTLKRFRLPIGLTHTLKSLLRGDAIRPHGFRIYSCFKNLPPKDLAEFYPYMGCGNRKYEWLSVDAAIARNGSRFLYSGTTLLSYLLAREVGWVHPEDLDWLDKDYLKLGNQRWNGFFMSPRPRDAFDHVDFLEDRWQLNLILRDCPRYTRDELEIFFRTGVLLEVDLEVFRNRLPAENSLAAGLDYSLNEQDNKVPEYVAPYMATNHKPPHVKPILFFTEKI